MSAGWLAVLVPAMLIGVVLVGEVARLGRRHGWWRYPWRWFPRAVRCPYQRPVTTGSWVVPTVAMRCMKWRWHRGVHTTSIRRP